MDVLRVYTAACYVESSMRLLPRFLLLFVRAAQGACAHRLVDYDIVVVDCQ
jgi:hypothetical protein